MTNEEEQYVLGLIKNALEVTSDEKEGTQTVDLSKINLCSIDYTDFTGYKNSPQNGEFNMPTVLDSLSPESFIEDERPPGVGGLSDTGNKANMPPEQIKQLCFNEDILDILTSAPEDLPKVLSEMSSDVKIIIEFAQPSLNDPEELEYSLAVEPGQEITEDTIIGYVKQNGQLRTIKSMFSSGKVLANEDETDFLKLYPSECNRHIILDEVQYGTDIGIDTSVLEERVKEFQQESVLYDLITTHIALSILPNILLQRHSLVDMLEHPLARKLGLFHSGQQIFNDAKEILDKINENYTDDMKKLASEDNIKATKGNSSKIKDVGNIIIERRQKRLDDILNLYESRNDFEKCEYDPLYGDCQMLALGTDREDLIKKNTDKVSSINIDECLNEIRISKEEKLIVYKIVAAVLLLGNLEIKKKFYYQNVLEIIIK